MPKKAVAIYLILALIGAALFIFFTWPRTKDQIPASNNQRPFPDAPSAPAPSPNPGNIPAPETQPHPSTPVPQHGPTLRVMAWASPAEAQALEARLDDYGARTGRGAALTLVNDAATYRRDLADAMASKDGVPDVVLVDARNFSGLDPARDLANQTTDPSAAPRTVAAFTVNGAVKAAPAEFSVDLLFYNPGLFNRAGIATPGPHWNWDVLEAMSRAMASLKMKTAKGDPIYALELSADFDCWNMLCTQAGHPALDNGTWHVAEADGKDAEVRSLDFIHAFFQSMNVTAPLAANNSTAGSYFAQQRAAMLVAPSSLVAILPNFGYQITDLPRDMCEGTLAQVEGWAVTARSNQADAARNLANFLAQQPLHLGWTGVQPDAARDGFSQICVASLNGAVIPRVGARDAAMAHFIDDQIGQLARRSDSDADQMYARIQAEYLNDFAPPGGWPKPDDKLKPHASGATGELHDM